MKHQHKQEIIDIEGFDVNNTKDIKKDVFIKHCRNKLKQLKNETELTPEIIDNVKFSLYMSMHEDYGL